MARAAKIMTFFQESVQIFQSVLFIQSTKQQETTSKSAMT